MVEENSKPNNQNFFQEDFKGFSYINNTIACQFCQKNFLDNDTEKFWYLMICFHCVCRGCLIKYIQNNYVKVKGQLKCPLPLCGALLTEDDYYVLIKRECFASYKIIKKGNCW